VRGANWPTTSVRLVAAMRGPDEVTAWERFSTEYGPALFQFCTQRGLQPADAEDVVQTVFLGVHKRSVSFDQTVDRGRFRSWLSTIALRVIWKLRQRSLTAPLALMDPVELEGTVVAQQELLEEINACVLDLAIEQVRPEFHPEVWSAFAAIWSHGERPQAVAARLGKSTGWVYNAKFRVLQRLKEIVGRMAQDLDEL